VTQKLLHMYYGLSDLQGVLQQANIITTKCRLRFCAYCAFQLIKKPRL